jgi:hypothetical protein
LLSVTDQEPWTDAFVFEPSADSGLLNTQQPSGLVTCAMVRLVASSMKEQHVEALEPSMSTLRKSSVCRRLLTQELRPARPARRHG